MDNVAFLRTLSALSQTTRLRVVELLADAGSQGMASGALADALSIPRHLMSAHLTILTKAGIVTSEKTGRSIVYTIDHAGLKDASRRLADLASLKKT